MQPEEFFKEQNRSHSERYEQLNRSALKVAYLRVVVFLLAIIGFVYFINSRELSLALAILFVFFLAFGLLVKRHNKLRFKRDQHDYLAQINNEELVRLENNFTSIADGVEFNVEDHAYSEDLDILGKNSIYQLLNRTTTFPGKELLAKRLLGQKSVSELAQYQKSVSELAQSPDFIQQYQALGRHVKADSDDYIRFNTWLFNPPIIIRIKAFQLLKYLLPAIIFIGTVVIALLSITYYWLLPIVIVNMVLLGKYHNYAKDVVDNTTASIAMLKSFEYHLALIESKQFTSEFLIELQKRFKTDAISARLEIKKISELLENLQARNNLLHAFINIPLLLDIHWLNRIENWQERNKVLVTNWFEALAEFEVLNSLAGQSFSQPAWVFPHTSSEPYLFQAKDLGHPMINENIRINNDFPNENTVLGNGKVVLLTGPNMAGKSTFLRTVAVNLVLAKMGGAVCATQLSFNPEMEVFTAMRIKDNLSESISSFYAELSRIKQLLNKVNEGIPIFYFLDEILKGTNSADRHKGAVALIKQLIDLGVSGFVSTHDITLGEMAKEFDHVSNYSFESIIEGDQITFDYKIREGICQSFNASELMRQMGIKI